MATSRQSIIRGPGTVKIGTVKIFDASGITADIDSATSDIPSSIAGKLDTIKTDQIGKIALTPVGNLTADLLAILFPSWAQTPDIGRSVFGSTDSPLIVSSRAGQKVTFKATGITKLPEIYLSPVKTAFGSVEFTALLANGKLPNETNAFYQVEAATYADGEPPRNALSGFHYGATWGTGQGAFTIPDTLDGWTITPELQLEPVTTDSQGTIDYTLTGVTVRASCTPLGLSESDILAKLPVSSARGSSLASANDLVITAANPGLTVTLKKASLVTGPIQWGATMLRAGQLGFVANIDATDGSLFEVGITAAPDDDEE